MHFGLLPKLGNRGKESESECESGFQSSHQQSLQKWLIIVL